MAFSTQKNFFAAINGVTVQDIAENFDYSKLSLEERKQIVKSMLEGKNKEFFETYFSKYFEANIGQNDYLSEEVNVCSLLERMANYLLASTEVKELEDKEKIEYKYYKDTRSFKKAVNHENNLETLTGEGERANTVLHFLLANQKNQKIVKGTSINSKDLKGDNELSRILNDYNNLVSVVTEELNNPESKNNRFTLTRIKGGLKDDMRVSKEQLSGVFGEHMNPRESTKYDVDLFDLSNKKHLLGGYFVDSKGDRHFAKGLIYMKPTEDLNNDFNLLLMELQGIIDECDFTETERKILEGVRSSIEIKKIAEEMKLPYEKVRSVIRTIIRKITRKAKQLKVEEK